MTSSLIIELGFNEIENILIIFKGSTLLYVKRDGITNSAGRATVTHPVSLFMLLAEI